MATKHILIVDDKPRVAFFLSKALERSNQNHCVSVAHSGEAALEILGSSPVDLLVTDLCMPGISGLELIRWVRAFSPQTRTILITAHDNDEAEAETHRLEAYRYITKPFDIGDFIKVVREALRDVAGSRPGLTIFSDETFEAAVQQLKNLCYDIGARCIFLANMQGQHLAETGDTSGLDAPTLLSMLAGGFTSSGKLARQFGSGHAINLNFHEGSRYDIYSTSVGDSFFLAIIYDRRVQASRIGIVWLYTRRAVENLLSTLSTGAVTTPDQASLAPLFPGPPPQGREGLLPTPPLHGEEKPLTNHQPRVKEDCSRATDAEQFLLGRPSDSAPGSPPASRADEGKRSYEDGPERELLDLETAIARGLIPPDLGNR